MVGVTVTAENEFVQGEILMTAKGRLVRYWSDIPAMPGAGFVLVTESLGTPDPLNLNISICKVSDLSRPDPEEWTK